MFGNIKYVLTVYDENTIDSLGCKISLGYSV